MDNKDGVSLIVNMIKKFISGENRTIAFAGEIETALDELFPEDEDIQEFVTCFASYRPGGGEFLYDEKAMVEKSKILLRMLQDNQDLLS